MKPIIFALTIAILAIAQPSFAIDTDIQDTRLRSAEHLERVLPVEWLADSMINDHARQVLPVNYQTLCDYIKANIDWDSIRKSNIHTLASRFTTDELDTWAGETFTRYNIRFGVMTRVLLPETRALIRTAIDKATWDFEMTQQHTYPGFSLNRQSFMEYQARNGIYYAPVQYYWSSNWSAPTYQTWYYSRSVQ
ncbi:MAG: hypothetical protein EYC62_07360 [Alphaproteobacteria bacterium]|nr:MAG: hypothetical protein EYC62_07360 [Alphaproteobacteria bacterium]